MEYRAIAGMGQIINEFGWELEQAHGRIAALEKENAELKKNLEAHASDGVSEDSE